jgi:hypothetical protein
VRRQCRGCGGAELAEFFDLGRRGRGCSPSAELEELLWELADQLEPENGMLWKDLIALALGMSPSLRSG